MLKPPENPLSGVARILQLDIGCKFITDTEGHHPYTGAVPYT